MAGTSSRSAATPQLTLRLDRIESVDQRHELVAAAQIEALVALIHYVREEDR
jgi:hypothetical protein